jgi:predicted nuclease of predicted toxin-antitoxin system
LIRFLLDQGVPRDAAGLLRNGGYECSHVGDIGMSLASDPEILQRAFDDHAVLITLDADFHMILAVTSAISPSVIRLRMEGLDSAAVAKIIQGVVNHFQNELTQGSMITVKGNKTTCHMLPIGARDDHR